MKKTVYVPFIPKTYVDRAGRYSAAEKNKINAWIDQQNISLAAVEFTGLANANTYRREATECARRFVQNSPYPFLHFSCRRK